MRHEQVPDNRLKCLGVRRDGVWIDRRNDDAIIGHPGGIAAVAADDANDLGPHLPGIIERRYQVGADIFLGAAAANRKNTQHVARLEPADFEPLHKDGCPAFVVGARGQLGDVIGRRVGLDAGQLPKIIDGVRAVGGAAADAQEK